MFIEIYNFVNLVLGYLSTFSNTLIDFFTTEIQILNWSFTPLEMMFGSGFVVVISWLIINKAFVE